jgi:hypothetical protein
VSTEEIQRRTFLAIAASHSTDTNFQQLNVGEEAKSMRKWLLDPGLRDRRFHGDDFEHHGKTIVDEDAARQAVAEVTAE